MYSKLHFEDLKWILVFCYFFFFFLTIYFFSHTLNWILKPEVGKTSVLTWVKLHKRPCKVHHVNKCYKQLYNLAQGHNTAISQKNQNDPPMPLNKLNHNHAWGMATEVILYVTSGII